MLTKDEFDKIEVGDEVETIPLLPALCPDALVFHPTMKDVGVMEFAMTYCGITLGPATCSVEGETVKWFVK